MRLRPNGAFRNRPGWGERFTLPLSRTKSPHARHHSLYHHSICRLRLGALAVSLVAGRWLLFLVRSKFAPFFYLRHGLDLVRGKFDNPNDPGHISHFSALTAGMAGTIGMGNIAGVALAIQIGGPGAIFWMWMTAILGIATKFFTCSLAVMYRGYDDKGELQGGPMYVIREALPKRWHFLASLFAVVGLVGCLPALQSNQLIQIFRDLVMIEQGFLSPNEDPFTFNLISGVVLAAITGAVIFGGLHRIAGTAKVLVPLMTGLYLVTVMLALFLNIGAIPEALGLIISDAFTGEAAAGGSVLAVILYGVQRGAYSNEAGMGTESLVHGAAKTNEPIREGLVAMLGPIIDTLVVCTATALMILIAGTWQSDASQGVTLTANAFSTSSVPQAPLWCSSAFFVLRPRRCLLTHFMALNAPALFSAPNTSTRTAWSLLSLSC